MLLFTIFVLSFMLDDSSTSGGIPPLSDLGMLSFFVYLLPLSSIPLCLDIFFVARFSHAPEMLDELDDQTFSEPSRDPLI